MLSPRAEATENRQPNDDHDVLRQKERDSDPPEEPPRGTFLVEQLDHHNRAAERHRRGEEDGLHEPETH